MRYLQTCTRILWFSNFCVIVWHKRLHRWLNNMRSKTLNQNSRLCASHFEDTCFFFSGGRKCLTSTAISTIFDYSLKSKHRTVQAATSNAEESVTRFTASHDHTYSKVRIRMWCMCLMLCITITLPKHQLVTKLERLKRHAQQIRVQSVSVATETSMEHQYTVIETPKSLKPELETRLLLVEEKLDSCGEKKWNQERKRWMKQVNSL